MLSTSIDFNGVLLALAYHAWFAVVILELVIGAAMAIIWEFMRRPVV